MNLPLKGIGTSLGLLANLLVSMSDEDFRILRTNPEIDLVSASHKQSPRTSEDLASPDCHFAGAVSARRQEPSSSVSSPGSQDGGDIQPVHLPLCAHERGEFGLQYVDFYACFLEPESDSIRRLKWLFCSLLQPLPQPRNNAHYFLPH